MEQEIAFKALRHFSIKPEEIHTLVNKPTRNVWRIVSTQGDYVLKRVKSKRRAKNISAASRFLSKKGVAVMKVLPTKDNLLYAFKDNQYFILSPWISNLNPSYTDQDMLMSIVTLLADFQIKSKGFEIRGSKNKNRKIDMFDWMKEYSKKKKSIEKRVREIHRSDDPFALLVLRNLSWIKSRIKWVIGQFPTTAYRSLIKKASSAPTLQHNDFAQHNLLLDQAGNPTIIDLDYICYGLRMWDLSRLITHVNHTLGWDINRFNWILETYQRKGKLNSAELDLVYLDQAFPHKVIDLINRYYNGKSGVTVESLERSIEIEKQKIMDLNLGYKW